MFNIVDRASLHNHGVIADTYGFGDGVYFRGRGIVTNTGAISGHFYGVVAAAGYSVDASGAPATIVNAGTITNADSGVQLNFYGGQVTNTGTAALISGGRNGLDGLVTTGPITITNAGIIAGGNYAGIYLYGAKLPFEDGFLNSSWLP